MARQLKLTWMADLKLEADLSALSVVCEVESIPFGRIDLKESQYNGARVGDALIHELVEDYKQGMLNGDTFPRIVVRQGPSGFIVLSGNQRTAAIATLIEEQVLPQTVSLEAYVVQTTDQLLLEIIARSGNVGHGGRSSKDERIAHAVYSVRKLGMQTADAAKIFNIAHTTVGTHVRAELKRYELAAAGVDTSQLPNATVDAIGRANDPPIELKLAHLTVQHRPSAERLKQVSAGIRKSRSHAGRLQKVKTFEKELVQEAHRSQKRTHQSNGASKIPQRPRRDRLIRDLRKLTEWLDGGMGGEAFRSLGDCQAADPEDRKVIRDLWGRLDLRMKVILKGK